MGGPHAPDDPHAKAQARPPAGLVLLTGGQGRRLGGPKHLQPHPRGGTWGGHLAQVFLEAFPGAPRLLLGSPLPDHPELAARPDSGRGPAAALIAWAAGEAQEPRPERWWVCACDHPAWTPARLRAWHHRAREADPQGNAWVLAKKDDYIQYLGGWLPDAFRSRLAGMASTSLRGLTQGMPQVLLEVQGEEWEDVDTPEALSAWRARPYSRVKVRV